MSGIPRIQTTVGPSCPVSSTSPTLSEPAAQNGGRFHCRRGKAGLAFHHFLPRSGFISAIKNRSNMSLFTLPRAQLLSQSHCQASPGIQNEINASYQCFFPNGSDDKDSVCNAGDLGSIPGLRRFPGEGNGYPLQYSCLKISMDREAW